MLLSFKLTTHCIPINLETNGQSVGYELREMSAAARDSYLDALGDRVRLGVDGKAAGMKKFEGMQADLLTRCLFTKEDSKGVAKDTIQGWPASVVNALFTEAQKINQLNQTDKEMVADSKNG